jgi:hypothetical protein
MTSLALRDALAVYALGCGVSLYLTRGAIWNLTRVAAVLCWPFFAAVWGLFLIGVAFFNVGNWR